MDRIDQEVIYIDSPDVSKPLGEEIPILLKNDVDKGVGIPTNVTFYPRDPSVLEFCTPVKPGTIVKIFAQPSPEGKKYVKLVFTFNTIGYRVR